MDIALFFLFLFFYLFYFCLFSFLCLFVFLGLSLSHFRVHTVFFIFSFLLFLPHLFRYCVATARFFPSLCEQPKIDATVHPYGHVKYFPNLEWEHACKEAVVFS